MGSWRFKNVGASAKPEQKKHVEKIFEYIGIAEKPAWSAGAYDECIFSDPDVYGCMESKYDPESGNVKECFGSWVFNEMDLLYLLNALFPGTSVYVHWTEGSTVTDTWEFHDRIYYAGNMTLECKDTYTSYGGWGPNCYESWKERFALYAPNLDYVNELINLSTADGNGELTALLLALAQKLKTGLYIVNIEDLDKRKIGEAYDVIKREWDSAWDMEKGLEEEKRKRYEAYQAEMQQRRVEAQKRREEERRQRAEEKQRVADEARKKREEARRQKYEEKQQQAEETRKARDAVRLQKYEAKLQAEAEKRRQQAEKAQARAEQQRLAEEAKAQKEQARQEAAANAVILYSPGKEPENLRKRLNTLFEKLDGAYPDKKISRLNQDHKKWGETVTELYRLLGYPDSQSFLEAYGYTVEKNAGGRPASVDPVAIMEELRHRYRNGGAESMDTLKNDNPDIPWKTLANNAMEYYGATLVAYLKQNGILGKPGNKAVGADSRIDATQEAVNKSEEVKQVSASAETEPSLPVASAEYDEDSWIQAIAAEAPLQDEEVLYLRTIHQLFQSDDTVRMIDVAKRLGQGTGKVSYWMKKLREKGILDTTSKGVITMLKP